MRVLAIRGRNLASLGDAFEVDLQRPPLSDVGLFAITGPTGAGKSTILDALCLALFDQVPRLPGGHGVLVGRADEDDAQRIKTTDVRSILRRGAGDGFAEVDFLGNDGRRYRSRWEVWRARGRADGRMQAQTVSLTDLDTGATVAQTKTEVLDEIARRIGLTFDQFRRSVLLAQGDFAAFLKADADERSNLLERITGTAVYSELSIAAYQRAGAESTSLAQLRARVQDLVPLPPAEREGVERRRAELEADQRVAAAERESVREVIAWHDRHAALLEAEQQARQGIADAEAEWQRAEDRRRELAAVVRAQPLRPALQAVADATAAAAAAKEQCEAAGAALEQARTAAATASARSRSAAGELDAARRRRVDQRDDIVKARALDSRIEHTAAQLDAAQRKRSDADAALTQARTRVDALAGRDESVRRGCDAAGAWLAEHQSFRDLASQWPRWLEGLERFGTAQGERDAVAAKLSGSVTEIERLGSEVAGHGAAVEQIAVRRATDEQALQALEAELRKTPREARRSERQALERRAGALRDAQALAREAAAASERVEEALRRSAKAMAQQEAAGTVLAEADEALPRLQAALEEANDAYRLAVASASESAEYLRATLRPGEPCAVCGATDHPYAGLQAVFDRQVEAQRERIALLDAERTARLRQRADALSLKEGTRVALTEAAASGADAEQALGRLSGGWAALALEDKPDVGLTDPGLLALLAQRMSTALARQEALAREEAAADALAAQVTQARTDLDGLRASQADAQVALQTAQGALARVRADTDTLRERHRAVVAELERLAGSLAPALEPLADWRARLERSPAAVREQCQTWVDLWGRHTRDRAEGERAIVELERELAEARAELRQAESAQQGLATEEQQVRGQLEALTAERQGVLGGLAAGVVEQQLEQAVAAAEQADASLRQALLDAQTALATAQQRAAQGSKDVTEREAALHQAGARLAGGLQRVGIARDALEALLARDEMWITAEQAAVTALQDAVAHWRSVLGERLGQRERHAANAPALDRADAEQALALATATLEELGQILAQTMAILQADDTRRAQSSALADAIAEQEGRTALWESMNDLIGSASGKKFRVYAQSLTLEALLAFANEHLRDLARRYRLQRVPRSDLELQVVDRDMGDEVRSVYSLSGGESFLVSLALALGLASLSSHSAQVESLFIDEGFGTLDQETLDVAIASLDTLQSLGRKVGVISHVPTLVERIGTQVRVSPRSGGRSVVEVLAA